MMKKKYDLQSVFSIVIFTLAILFASFNLYDELKCKFGGNLECAAHRGVLSEIIENPHDPNVRANIYFIADGGATVSASIRVSVTDPENIEIDGKTVYFQFPASDMESTELIWLDEDSFELNSIVVDVLDESTWYHWRVN